MCSPVGKIRHFSNWAQHCYFLFVFHVLSILVTAPVVRRPQVMWILLLGRVLFSFFSASTLSSKKYASILDLIVLRKRLYICRYFWMSWTLYITYRYFFSVPMSTRNVTQGRMYGIHVIFSARPGLCRMWHKVEYMAYRNFSTRPGLCRIWHKVENMA